MGRFIEQFEGRQMLAATPAILLAPAESVTVGRIDGQKVRASVLDDDGTSSLLSMTGPGTATLIREGDRFALSVEGTTDKSSLKINSRGGDEQLLLSSIKVNAPLGSLLAESADLSGEIELSADVGTLKLRTIGSGSTLHAEQIDSLSIGGNASLRLWADQIKTINIVGDLVDSDLQLFPAEVVGRKALKKLNVRGAVLNSHINAMGDVGTVSVGALIGSSVMAGVRYDFVSQDNFQQMLPTDKLSDHSSYVGIYKIQSITVRGRRGEQFSFDNSQIGAYSILRGTLDKVNPFESSDNTRGTGLAAYSIGRVSRRYGKVDLKSDVIHFRISQNEPEFLTFTPGSNGWGSYSGSLSSMGSVIVFGSGGGRTITHNAETLIAVEMPAEGVVLGDVKGVGTDAKVVMQPSGQFEICDGSTVLATDDSLGELIAGIVGVAGTSIKTFTSDDGQVYLSTSTGPRVVLHVTMRNANLVTWSESVSTSVMNADASGLLGEVNSHTGTLTINNLRSGGASETGISGVPVFGTVTGSGEEVTVIIPTTTTPTTPTTPTISLETRPAIISGDTVINYVTLQPGTTLAQAQAQLNDRSVVTFTGFTVQLPDDAEQIHTAITPTHDFVQLAKPPLMVGNDPLLVGQRIEAGRIQSIYLTPALTYRVVDAVGNVLLDDVSATAALYGPDGEYDPDDRFLPGLDEVKGNTVLYGTPGGGTAVLFAQTAGKALGPAGNLFDLPTTAVIRVALGQRHIEFTHLPG